MINFVLKERALPVTFCATIERYEASMNCNFLDQVRNSVGILVLENDGNMLVVFPGELYPTQLTNKYFLIALSEAVMLRRPDVYDKRLLQRDMAWYCCKKMGLGIDERIDMGKSMHQDMIMGMAIFLGINIHVRSGRQGKAAIVTDYPGTEAYGTVNIICDEQSGYFVCADYNGNLGVFQE